MSFVAIIGYLLSKEEPLTTIKKILETLRYKGLIKCKIVYMYNKILFDGVVDDLKDVKELKNPKVWITIKGEDFELTARNTCCELELELNNKELMEKMYNKLYQEPRSEGCTAGMYRKKGKFIKEINS